MTTISTNNSVPEFYREAGKKWIYPKNMAIRPYQQQAVHLGLFTNSMIVLPTGFGKTFIAAVVMYNFYLWYPTGKIIFVAPTRPLVAQQISECKKISGIPSSDCIELTGQITRLKREVLWQTKRVFFATPQVIQNDLQDLVLPARQIKCLVIDEAHRAQGGYAYVELVRHLQEQNRDGFRILALSATPGSDIERVRQVMMNLYIGDVMFRTENSIDLMSYRKQKQSKAWTVELAGKHLDYVNRFLEICQPNVREIYRSGLLYTGCDRLDKLNKYRILQLMNEIRSNQAAARVANKGRLMFCLAAAITMRHLFDLLTIYGIRPFYVSFKESLDEKKNIKNLVMANIDTDKLLNDIETQFTEYITPDPEKLVGQESSVDLLSGHPKLRVLKETLEKHFQDNSDKPDTRALVFCKFRESVYDVVQTLNSTSSVVKPSLFVGQKIDSRKLGLKQKDQIELIQKFKRGEYNTLVATSVAEEGLDIGEIDLVVLYDVSSDPISGTQRRGRTGRKRSGDVIILLTKDYEESKFKRGSQAKRNVEDQLYKRENYMTHRYSHAPRLVPDDIKPECYPIYITPVDDEEEPEPQPSKPKRRRKAITIDRDESSKKGSDKKGSFVSAKKAFEDDQASDSTKTKQETKRYADSDIEWSSDEDCLASVFAEIEKRRQSTN